MKFDVRIGLKLTNSLHRMISKIKFRLERLHEMKLSRHLFRFDVFLNKLDIDKNSNVSFRLFIVPTIAGLLPCSAY